MGESVTELLRCGLVVANSDSSVSCVESLQGQGQRWNWRVKQYELIITV